MERRVSNLPDETWGFIPTNFQLLGTLHERLVQYIIKHTVKF